MCPLCTTPVPEPREECVSSGETSGKAYPDYILDPEHAYSLTKGERRRIAFELVSLSFLLAAVALILADILFHTRPYWSLYALASIGFVWMVLSSLIVFAGKVPRILMTIPLATALYLLALDWMDGSITWSLSLGIPIVGSLLLIAIFVSVAIRFTRRKGFNVAAYACLGLAGLCFCVEAILDLNFLGMLSPSWSLVVGLALVPLSGMLLYIHGRVLRGADLRKVFRL